MNNKRPWILIVTAVLALGLFTLWSCGTIMHGSVQEIGIQSQPTGASVVIDNMEQGRTPVIAKLSRKDNHVINISLDGYEPVDVTVTRSTSGWVWGNIVFGGLIGLAVDAISGGLYKLKPEQVQAELRKSGTGNVFEETDIVISVVLHPNPTWEKIGSLTPIDR